MQLGVHHLLLSDSWRT